MFSEWINIDNKEDLKKIGNIKVVKKIIKDDLKEFFNGCNSKDKNICEMIKVTSGSWQGLVDKIIAIRTLTNKLGQAEICNDDEKYFKSETHKIIYFITQFDGVERMEKLSIYKAHYLNKKLAKEWYNNLAKKIHPDKTQIEGAKEAMSELANIYNEMVKNE